ncbi:YwqH-like family protein [Oceanobacillus saliphilus]|uniref:YwqH-like family protein n=1 Tax=Oceanobacillus saliphilus TaxID=2925834 RepID=UPI00201D4CDA|nr:DUF5082 family protein [Oceanobacillus saliphilus]
MSTDLSLLRRQRSTVLQGMSNSREQINILADKIARLQAASNSLQSSITALESSKSAIDSLSVDSSWWKGTNETKFYDRYATYQDSVQAYVRKSKDAKDGIDDEIRRTEQSRLVYTNGLNNLHSTLQSLENQISIAERE